MHRSTPLSTAFRAYTAGGARAVISSVDDSLQMQAATGNFMAGEQRQNIEAPQNYGFTSVTMDADQDQGGGQGGAGGAGGGSGGGSSGGSGTGGQKFGM